MSKIFTTALTDIEPSYFISFGYRIRMFYYNGLKVILSTIVIFLICETVRFVPQILRLNYKISDEIVYTVLLDFKTTMIVFFCILIISILGIVITQRKYRWIYSEECIFELKSGLEKTYSYMNIVNITIHGKYRVFVDINNSPNFPKVISVNWYGSQESSFFEFLEFLISKNDKIKNSINLQNFKNKNYYNIPADNYKETLVEYFQNLKYK